MQIRYLLIIIVFPGGGWLIWHLAVFVLDTGRAQPQSIMLRGLTEFVLGQLYDQRSVEEKMGTWGPTSWHCDLFAVC